MLKENFDISKITWFKTGGLVKFFAVVTNKAELKEVVSFFNENFILAKKIKINGKNYSYNDIYIIGNGSNILVSDNGFDGLIIKLEGIFSNIDIIKDGDDGGLVRAGCGVLSNNLSKFARDNKIKNFEFLSTIPGSIGGNIFMNAGCYGGEISQIIEKIEYFDKETASFSFLEKKDINFQERSSGLSRDVIIIFGYFKIEIGNFEEISCKMQNMQKSRTESQIIGVKTCGSTFVNPISMKAWKLVDEVGLRGFAIGGAKFSEKHSNFIVNFNNATSQDIKDLINLAKQRIKEKFNIDMRTEIEILE